MHQQHSNNSCYCRDFAYHCYLSTYRTKSELRPLFCPLKAVIDLVCLCLSLVSDACARCYGIFLLYKTRFWAYYDMLIRSSFFHCKQLPLILQMENTVITRLWGAKSGVGRKTDPQIRPFVWICRKTPQKMDLLTVQVDCFRIIGIVRRKICFLTV